MNLRVLPGTATTVLILFFVLAHPRVRHILMQSKDNRFLNPCFCGTSPTDRNCLGRQNRPHLSIRGTLAPTPPLIPDDNPNNTIGSYRRTVTVPESWAGRPVFITFDGVYSFFYLWVNGRKSA